MRYIKKFNEVKEYTIEEDMECCKDIIETISEWDPDIEVDCYRSGYCEYDTDPIVNTPKTEKAKRCIGFRINVENKKEVDGIYNSGKNYRFNKLKNTSEIDLLSTLLNKSKTIFLRLSEFSDTIYYNVTDLSITFRIMFENQDEELKKSAKAKRLIEKLKEKLSDWKTLKRLVVKDNELFKFNDTEKKKGMWDRKDKVIEPREINEVVIKCAIGIGFDKIKDCYNLSVSRFAWKEEKRWNEDEKFNPFTPNKEQLDFLMKRIVDKIEGSFFERDDKNALNYKIEGSKIQITIK